MKILLVSSFLPYPLFSGGHIRLYNIVKGLSKNNEITLVCEKRDYQTKEDIKEVEKFCKKIISFERKTQWSFGNIIKTGFSLSPFLMVGHTIPAMKVELRELLKREYFDLIHVETSYVMQNLPKTQVPIVLVEHNIEYLVYERFVKNAPLPLRPLLYLDVFKLKLCEESMWKRAAKLVAVSEVDKKVMNRIKKDVQIVPNGVDITKFKIHSDQIGTKLKIDGEKRVLFIGDFKWIQNTDAIEWILKEIWPLISSKFKVQSSKLMLWVVGRKIPQDIKDLGDDSVIFDENAPKETELIYQKSNIVLTPIRVGGGTSYKILEGMASGVPVVTTPLGNAMNAKENSEIVIAKTSEDFVRSIKKLLEDEKFYETISANARKLVEEKYDWRNIVKKLEEVYKSASRDAEIHSTSSGS